MQDARQKPLCIYHGNCQDGFAAAWVVNKAHQGEVELYPGVYQEAPPDVAGRDVVMVDFSYKRPVIEALARQARTLLILDHHKSAAEDLAGFAVAPAADWRRYARRGNALVRFDMEKSGAGLAWDYFFPGQLRPRLIDFVEDRDLWRFRLPHTKAVSANLFSYPYDLTLWDRLVAECERPVTLQQFVVAGEAIGRKATQDIDNLLPVVQREFAVAGVVMPVANLPLTLTSEAGQRMARASPGKIAACYWDTQEGRVFSLRSTEDGPDCQALAVKMGGGGHAHAAGFRVPLGATPDAPQEPMR